MGINIIIKVYRPVLSDSLAIIVSYYMVHLSISILTHCHLLLNKSTCSLVTNLVSSGQDVCKETVWSPKEALTQHNVHTPKK